MTYVAIYVHRLVGVVVFPNHIIILPFIDDEYGHSNYTLYLSVEILIYLTLHTY